MLHAINTSKYLPMTPNNTITRTKKEAKEVLLYINIDLYILLDHIHTHIYIRRILFLFINYTK